MADKSYQSALATARRVMQSDATDPYIINGVTTTGTLGVSEQAALCEAARHEVTESTPHSHGKTTEKSLQTTQPLADVMQNVLQRQQQPVVRTPDPNKSSVDPAPTYISEQVLPCQDAPPPRDHDHEREILLVSDSEPYALHDIFVLVCQDRVLNEYKNDIAELPFDLTMLVLSVWLLVASY